MIINNFIGQKEHFLLSQNKLLVIITIDLIIEDYKKRVDSLDKILGSRLCICIDFLFQEKDRAQDLMDASVYAEDMCNELVSISSSLENPGVILQGVDKMQRPFLDVLIECELKQVNKSHTYVQP